MTQNNRGAVLVRDDTDYFDLERALLERGGYEVVRVTREELVERAVAIQPVVIVLDVGHEGRDLALADALREEAGTRHLGILGMGGRTGITRRSALAHGINRILFKPFSPSRFLADIEALSHVSDRRPLELDVVLTRIRPQRLVVRGTTVNVSDSGLLLRTKEQLGLGHKFTLQGKTKDGPLRLAVRVVREASEYGPGYYGLVFRSPSAGADRLLAARSGKRDGGAASSRATG